MHQAFIPADSQRPYAISAWRRASSGGNGPGSSAVLLNDLALPRIRHAAPGSTSWCAEGRGKVCRLRRGRPGRYP